jgi:3-oxoacyl-[acyl-carrier-protein] synthase-1
MPGVLSILGRGLVTPVGLTAPASCAAIRAKIANPTETHFLTAEGDFLLAHEVPLERPWRGHERLARMAAMAIEEALGATARAEWASVPLILCLAEPERPGRDPDLEDRVFSTIEELLDVTFAPSSEIVAAGRTAR